MAEEILLDVQHLTRVFPLGRRMSVRAVDDLSFQIRRGEIFGLVGESGSGKSTAARCVMNLCRPQSGRILYKGIDTCDRAAFRANRRMLQTTRQLIFQDTSSSLNQRMRVWDIIAEPLRLQRVVPPRGSLRAEAAFQMHYVGLDESFLDKYPPELSGGQRQRVAIARALAAKPAIILADEPTGNLDSRTSQDVMALLKITSQKFVQTIVMITHNEEIAQMADRIIRIEDGKIRSSRTTGEEA